MNFDYTEEQTMLRDSVKRYVADNYDFESRKAIVASGGSKGGFSPTVWAALAELGVLGLTASADAGGSEMDAQAAMVVMEELGRGIVMEPVAACALMPLAILKSLNNTAFAESIAEGIADGSKPVAVAYLEHAHRYHWHTCSAVATEQTGTYALSGTKSVVAGAAQSTTLIVSAMLHGELALFAVATAQATLQAYATQDGSAAADVQLHNTPAQLLATGQAAVDALQSGVNALIAAHAAESVGLMEAMCDMTADYLNTRKQFGTAIGTFQALRHRLVDMRLEMELARGMSWKANIALSDVHMSLAEQTATCSAAKCDQNRFL